MFLISGFNPNSGLMIGEAVDTEADVITAMADYREDGITELTMENIGNPAPSTSPLVRCDCASVLSDTDDEVDDESLTAEAA
jgi:lipoate synthase